jgi:predicted transcriptional regulator
MQRHRNDDETLVIGQEETLQWLSQGERRMKVLLLLALPMTARQLSLKTNMPLDSCSYALWELEVYGLVQCLNGAARRSRVFGLTEKGRKCQTEYCKRQNLEVTKPDYPEVDWNLYGWVCYSHRSAVLRAMSGIMQPVEIKRRAKYQNPKIRMSANNVRDIVYMFLEKGIVRKTDIRRKAHPRYELTKMGCIIQRLLCASE